MNFHPFTGMAPLKHITVLINLPAFDNFHPFTGMAPLKPGEGANPAGILPHFHPFTGMAPLKPETVGYTCEICGEISIPSQGWPH